MFYKKKPALLPMVMKVAGYALATVGAITITSWALAKCGCLGNKAKRIAKQCEDAMGDMLHQMHPTASTDACPLSPEDYHLPTCNAPRA